MDKNTGCPLCENEEATRDRNGDPKRRDAYLVECPECGLFIIAALLPRLEWAPLSARERQKWRRGLVAYVREHNQKRADLLEIFFDNWKGYAQEGLKLVAPS